MGGQGGRWVSWTQSHAPPPLAPASTLLSLSLAGRTWLVRTHQATEVASQFRDSVSGAWGDGGSVQRRSALAGHGSGRGWFRAAASPAQPEGVLWGGALVSSPVRTAGHTQLAVVLNAAFRAPTFTTARSPHRHGPAREGRPTWRFGSTPVGCCAKQRQGRRGAASAQPSRTSLHSMRSSRAERNSPRGGEECRRTGLAAAGRGTLGPRCSRHAAAWRGTRGSWASGPS